MPFVIPNATDTTSGNKYQALDQAEPDALDFEILGNRASGILTGCEVTPQPNYNIKISAGIAVLDSVAYVISETTNLPLPTAPNYNRFDIVVLRKSGATLTPTVVYGTDSILNPTFPPSTPRMVTTLPVDRYIDTTTDVVLAAIYRPAAAGITSQLIVDKRTSIKSSISLQGISAPDAGVGSNGDLYYKSGTLTATESSGVFVKRNSAWQELAKSPIDPGVPIGTVIMWPSGINAPNSLVWDECDGASVSRVGTHTALFNVIGTEYGAVDGNSYNLPNFKGHYLAGLPETGGVIGTRVGAVNHTLVLNTSNIPSHDHGLAGATAVSVGSHQHPINHEHIGAVTGTESQPHVHPFSGNTGQVQVDTNQNLITTVGNAPGYATSQTISSVQSPNNNIPHSHPFSGTTQNSVGSHSHPVTIPAVATSSGDGGTHGHSLTGNTQSTGSGAAFNIQPSTFYVRFFIRYA